MDDTIKIEYFRKVIQLKEPYKLSFTTVESFDSYFVRISDSNNVGVGEVTALYGYSWETGDDINAFIVNELKTCSSIDELEASVSSKTKTNPFGATPILTALELFRREYMIGRNMQAPLIGLLSGSTDVTLLCNIKKLIELGFSTLKVKIGRDVDADVRKLKLIKKLLPSGCKLRLDANQGYTYDEARYLLPYLSSDYVELLEQPFNSDEWELMTQLNAVTTVPLMLDESTWTKDDIDKTIAHQAASLVKLKLFKHCSPKRTVDLARYAQSRGLGVVLGNGVQTELACLYEGSIQSNAGLTLPGEMNGWLKQARTMKPASLELSEGAITARNNKMPLFEESEACLQKELCGSN